MNFLAHARHFADRPYAAAGSGLPDWTRPLARRARIRPKTLRRPDPEDQSVDAEVLRVVWAHIDDDTWFHQVDAFKSGTHQIAERIREALAPDRVRASFLAHILLEMLLDAALIEREPDLCDAYYAAMESVDAGVIGRVARDITPGLDAGDDKFQLLLDRFIGARFLADYGEDESLARRLSQVARRVKLDALDARFLGALPHCRRIVEEHYDALIEPPASFSPPSAAPRA